MKFLFWLSVITLFIQGGACATPPGASIFRLRPEDPHAIYFTPDNYKITADGRTDISDALQQAIRTLKTRDNFGVIFIPEGKYRISRTIYIPTAIRLIGYGKTRPLIVLAPNSPGFQSAGSADKGQGRYMFWFVSGLTDPGQPIRDAGASTFYSALSNINLKIENGNSAAIALRTHFAQHSYISHVDIDAGNGRAGLFDVGNEMEDIRFFGGDYGIFTTKPSPGWPCAIVDSWFEGQRRAAIRTREAGLVLIRLQAKKVPVVVDIDSNYHEKLFMEDGRFEDIKETAIRISNEDNAFSQVSLRNIACRNTPVLAEGRLTHRRTTAPSLIYIVKSFTDGLQLDGWSAEPVYATTKDLRSVSVMPAVTPSDIPAFPDMASWTNLRSSGAIGDGVSDDTKAIQDAIDTHDVIYVPQGWYRISTPVKLKPTTILIGLHPFATQFLIADNTPAFGGFGGPQPMLEAPPGGTNILSGIGLNTNASNPRAVACKWQAGEHSYMNDVKFVGGHGGIPRPNTADTARRQSERDWDTQYWSLWVTNGGGGAFKDIWTANTYAAAGAYFSHTSTPGRVYALSVEHHVRNEVRFNAVDNWKVYALQLEEESRESTECQPMELQDCHDMTFANLYMFRVIRVNKPYPYSIRRWGGHDLEFLNVHNYSQIIYTTTDPLYDVNTNTTVRPWEFARLFIGPETAAPQFKSQPTSPQVTSPAQTQPTLLATGFEFAQSPCRDSKGNIYFCDSRLRRIYKFCPATRQTTLLADYPWQPLSLACDKKDNLLVVFKYVPKPGTGETFTNPPDAAGTSFSGWGNSGFATWVYSIDANNPDESIRLLPTRPMGTIDPVDRALYPAHRWRDYHDFNPISVQRPQQCFVAPDGMTIIPVVYDLARSTALAEATPGKPSYTSDEYDKRTVVTNVDNKGYQNDLRYFAQHGEFATATDAAGNVYIADGQIYVYDPQGRLINTLKTPERPTGLCISPDQHTLYTTGHQSLYELPIK